MKYTIEGFSQEYAYSLRNDKQKVDFTDLVILRWFVDFYPKMQKIVVDDKTYAWVSYGKLLEDLPMLDITKRALRDRLQKLCDFGILIHHVIRKGGVFSCYGFGENYHHLVGSKVLENADHEKSTSTGKVQSTSIAFGSQLPNKDNSIINNSIIDSSGLSANKESKSKSSKLSEQDFLTMCREKFEDEEVIDLLIAWNDNRNLAKKPLTKRALEIALNKLEDCAIQSRLSLTSYLEEVIVKGWLTFYPITNKKPTEQTEHIEFV